MDTHPFISHWSPKSMEERKEMGIKITNEYYNYFYNWKNRVPKWKKKNMKTYPIGAY